MENREKEFLEACVYDVLDQLADDPDLLLPLDPDVADLLGAFEEKALSEEDF